VRGAPCTERAGSAGALGTHAAASLRVAVELTAKESCGAHILARARVPPAAGADPVTTVVRSVARRVRIWLPRSLVAPASGTDVIAVPPPALAVTGCDRAPSACSVGAHWLTADGVGVPLGASLGALHHSAVRAEGPCVAGRREVAASETDARASSASADAADSLALLVAHAWHAGQSLALAELPPGGCENAPLDERTSAAMAAAQTTIRCC